jgi:2-oxoglutarate dehydrogenase E1 component
MRGDENSVLFGSNAKFIQELFARYLQNPSSVDPSWQGFFAELSEDQQAILRELAGPSWAPNTGQVIGVPEAEPAKKPNGNGQALAKGNGQAVALAKANGQAVYTAQELRAAAIDSIRALMLIRAYRIRGHLMADLDPLGLTKQEPHPELDPATYGFGEADWDRPIFVNGVLGLEVATLREIMAILKQTYCGKIGVEFMHIGDPMQKAWIQERIEGIRNQTEFTVKGKRAIFERLVEAEGLEKFLHVKFVATKRFGLDGGESLVPAMEQILKRGGQLGVKEVVIGMPHRGRLNILTNMMGKSYTALFSEFQGNPALPESFQGSGDVKYHLGASSDREFDGNVVHLSLTANPSHLELVNTVVLGKVRAKQQQRGDTSRDQVMAVLMHGDAAFAGQGLVAETLDLSDLKGYRTGGTIHVIVNNQIGFTTAPRYSRSSPYPSDVALMVQAPIFHVNGDDPEAVVYAAKVATEYRQIFGKDVVIDMFCYRRFGHNEGDDPTMTQPLMYKRIKDQPTTLTIYADRLVGEATVAAAEVEGWKDEFAAFLDKEFETGKAYQPSKADWLDGVWSGITLPQDDDRRGKTEAPRARLIEVGRRITEIPKNFDMHKTVHRVIEARRKAIEDGHGIDWALAEHLAFGTLLDEGFPVRLSGQDSCRGTFSQRHSHFIDQTTEDRYTPLNSIRPGQAHYEVIDSLLSEEAVLGFEYGYSTAAPKTLTLWEAQFGDFVNGAQVVIDQFISSGERKWLRMSGLVMLLPHGYEGQGPEHSSARIERFLQLCAEDNMQVVNCTTPANYFHALRRQLHRDFRKPLIVFTPKSLLRHKKCVSSLDEMAEGTSFHRVLWDDAQLHNGNTTVQLKGDSEIRRVVLCSGKVYYDLLDEREKRGLNDIYLLRLEQFYPWPMKSILAELGRFPNAEIVWCQEEPKNMGGWSFVEPWLEISLGHLSVKSKAARYAGRPATASTAAGLMKKHLKELDQLLEEALG